MGESYTYDGRLIRGGAGVGGAPYDREAKAPPFAEATCSVV